MNKFSLPKVKSGLWSNSDIAETFSDNKGNVIKISGRGPTNQFLSIDSNTYHLLDIVYNDKVFKQVRVIAVREPFAQCVLLISWDGKHRRMYRFSPLNNQQTIYAFHTTPDGEPAPQWYHFTQFDDPITWFTEVAATMFADFCSEFIE